MPSKSPKKFSALEKLKTLRVILKYGEKEFKKKKLYFGHGTDNAWDEAVYLALHALDLPFDTDPKILDKVLTSKEQEKILKIFRERSEKRIPAAYLTKYAWFCGLPFYVDERVLIPRSPFAELIENHFSPFADHLKIKRILDIGTGSGCMAIAAAKYFPKAKVDAVDLDPSALKVAQINVAKHRLKNRVRLIKSDVFSALKNATYDIIISNPPYVGSEEMKTLPPEYAHEPQQALETPAEGLYLVEKILQKAGKHLNQDGLLFVEVGNSEELLAQRYPKIPFLWLELERGGGGVFMLTQEDLKKILNFKF